MPRLIFVPAGSDASAGAAGNTQDLVAIIHPRQTRWQLVWVVEINIHSIMDVESLDMRFLALVSSAAAVHGPLVLLEVPCQGLSKEPPHESPLRSSLAVRHRG